MIINIILMIILVALPFIMRFFLIQSKILMIPFWILSVIGLFFLIKLLNWKFLCKILGHRWECFMMCGSICGRCGKIYGRNKPKSSKEKKK